MLFVLPLVSLLFALVHARALNVCDWVNASPLLYHQYGEESCPARYHHQSNGLDCEWRIVPGDFYSCDSFCQIRTSFSYSMESPILSNPYCFGPVTCSVGSADYTVYNGGQNIGESVDKKTLNDAVTGGWHGLSKGKSLSSPESVTLKENECGYFTFLPVVREVCGTHTWGRTHNSVRKDCGSDFKTEGNSCNSELLLADLGRAPSAWGSSIPNLKGDTIFVRTDCNNHAPLPMDKQNPAYRHPGVAMPHVARDAYTSFFTKQADVHNLAVDAAKTDCGTGNNGPKAEDCITALQDLIGNPSDIVAALNVEDSGKNYATLSTSNTCAVRVYYDDQFTRSSGCDVNNVEAVTAAGKILDTCLKDGGVQGKHPIRPRGNCGCHVALEKA